MGQRRMAYFWTRFLDRPAFLDRSCPEMPGKANDFKGPISGPPFLDSAGVHKWPAYRISNPSFFSDARIVSRPFIDFSGPRRFSTRCVQVPACSSWRAEKRLISAS